MSIDYRGIILEEEKVDEMWKQLAVAKDEDVAAIIKSVFVKRNTGGLLNDFEYIPNHEFWEIREEIRNKKREYALMHIAALDQLILSEASFVQFVPESGRGFMVLLSMFAFSVGLTEIDKYGGGECNVTTERWIAGFQAFTKEKQEEIKQALHGEESEGWQEFAHEIAQIRDMAKYCFDNKAKMLVFTSGDAVLTPYFAKRAETIYSMLEEALS